PAHRELRTTRLQQRFAPMVLADAHEQAAFGDRCYQVTVQHKADPAEHFDFGMALAPASAVRTLAARSWSKAMRCLLREEVTRRDRFRAVNIEDSALALDTTKLGHWGSLFLDDLTPVVRTRQLRSRQDRNSLHRQ